MVTNQLTETEAAITEMLKFADMNFKIVIIHVLYMLKYPKEI